MQKSPYLNFASMHLQALAYASPRIQGNLPTCRCLLSALRFQASRHHSLVVHSEPLRRLLQEWDLASRAYPAVLCFPAVDLVSHGIYDQHFALILTLNIDIITWTSYSLIQERLCRRKMSKEWEKRDQIMYSVFSKWETHSPWLAMVDMNNPCQYRRIDYLRLKITGAWLLKSVQNFQVRERCVMVVLG